MTADDDSVHFGLVELDLLATHAGVPVPYPLRVPSFGRIESERDILLATAGLTLQARGFADGHGPAAQAAELVKALREHRGTVDLVLIGPDAPLGVVAMVYRSSALICSQQLTGDLTSTVTVRQVDQTAVTDELIRLVPELSSAVSMPITLPPGVVQAAPLLVDGDTTATEQRLRDLVRDRGGGPDVLDRLAALLPTLIGRGQLGATRRTSSRITRAGTGLSWLDGPAGRIRIDRAADGWVSVNPLRRGDMRFALHELATIARKDHDDISELSGPGTLAQAL